MFRKPPYYLTAYGLAVREGFKGTLEQWLESLRGEKGDGVELRYQDDKLQWRSVPPEGAQIPEDWEEDEWKDLLELEDIRGPVVEQTLEQAQQAAQEAELMASHAQGHEQMAAQYAQEALEAARFVAVTTEYAVSEDGSTPPKAWETDIPEMTAEKPFLWMKVNKNYTDGTAAADVGVIGRYSADGKDGSSTTITLKYGVSSTPSMNTVTGWQDTIPQMSETYPYLWIEISTETTTATGGSSTVEAGIIGYYSTPGSGGSGGGSDYVLPVGGDELGGVKNGGNVVINEDGTMTAPESSGGTVEVDTTLTKEGMAADAKAVGDALKEVGQPTDEQIAGAVSDWIEANPDKVTTVQDGAISTEKLADDAVTPGKTAFLIPNSKPVEAECIYPNVGAYSGYADTTNNQYYNAGWLERKEDYTTGLYVCPVKAGKTYTIVPSIQAGLYNVYFCTAYSLKEPTDAQKAVWTRPAELLGYMSYTGAVKLCTAYMFSYNDRQTKFRYTPASDGYLVGLWHMISGMLVYEGASPSAKYEEIIDAPDGAITSANYIFYSWTEETSERFRKLSRVDPDADTTRLLRRGEYYQNLILSNLKLKCFGDSITFGSSVGVGNRYLDFLGAKLGIDITNCGVNGATATTGYGMEFTVGGTKYGTGADGFISAYLQDMTTSLVQDTEKHNQFDVFTIALGTNDWIYNAPLGTYADTVDTATFYGCYKKLIARIRELYPNAPIILLTPWQQFYNDIHWYEANDAGFSIRDYAMAIHEIAMMTRNCWVIDMLNNAHITEKDNSEDGVYVDGVHIGRKAHILVAHELEKVLMQVIMMNGLDYVPLTTVTDSFTGQK